MQISVSLVASAPDGDNLLEIQPAT